MRKLHHFSKAHHSARSQSQACQVSNPQVEKLSRSAWDVEKLAVLSVGSWEDRKAVEGLAKMVYLAAGFANISTRSPLLQNLHALALSVIFAQCYSHPLVSLHTDRL